MGGQDTFENTLFRLQTPNGLLLVLVYVDDLLVAAESPAEGEAFVQKLQNIWRIKLTGRIPALKRGVLQFLGRTIYRERDRESTLSLGVSEAYMTGIIDSWHEKLKPNETPPKLEEIYKDREKQGEDTPLTAEGEARYRRVLGQLAWAALSRADLCFSVSYLARFQSKPSGAAEACLRALLRWLLTRLRSPRADHTFSGRIAKHRTAKRCWFLRRVLECGLRVRWSLDVRRLLHQSVF